MLGLPSSMADVPALPWTEREAVRVETEPNWSIKGVAVVDDVFHSIFRLRYGCVRRLIAMWESRAAGGAAGPTRIPRAVTEKVRVGGR